MEGRDGLEGRRSIRVGFEILDWWEENTLDLFWALGKLLLLNQSTFVIM
jgi:hypothetical protein